MNPLKTKMQKKDTPLIFFDGFCGFCTTSIQWLIRRDKRAIFRFAPIQSEIGRRYYQKSGLDPKNILTFLLVKKDRPYIKSDAVLETLKTLGGLWRSLGIFYLIPRPIRDCLYDLLAKNRLHLMGRHQSCLRSPEAIRIRFLE